jgi:hypothetical protein
MLIATTVVILDANYLVTRNPGTTSSATTSSTTTTSTVPTQPALITKSQSGLVASDPLSRSQTQQQLLSNQTYWVYGGSAGTQSSSYAISVAASQLQIGVASPTEGQWVGYYAVSPPTNATLAHAVLTSPSSSVPGHYSVGLYVQATNQILNYVGCLAATTPQGTTWEVVHDHATNTTNGVIVPLWGVSNAGQKLTQDCTIITNGTNYLKVYLNNVIVYQSSTLQLGMQGPYNFYLETETSSAGSTTYGGYQNFYATHGENVEITGAPSKALTAAIVDSTGKVYSTAPVVSGSATLAMGQYTYPLVAYVKLYSTVSDTSNSSVIASTQHPVSIYGGDVFAVGSGTSDSKQMTLRINAMDTNGNNLTGISAVLSQNRQTIASGYMPVVFSLNNSQSYSVRASDYGTYTFDHWSDGSTLRTRTLSVVRNTTLTAFYRNVDAAAPSGMSLLSVAAVDSTGKPLTGFDVSVWQDGSLVATSFTPGSFLLKDGVQYQVTVSSYGNYKFDHWSGGIKDAIYLVSGSSATPVINLVAVYAGSG